MKSALLRLTSIRKPSSYGTASLRRGWIFFAIFLALALSYDVYRWPQSVGEPSKLAGEATGFFLVLFQLAKRPRARLFFFFTFNAFLVIAIVLMTLRVLRFIHPI
jgi:hypothetical protein